MVLNLLLTTIKKIRFKCESSKIDAVGNQDVCALTLLRTLWATCSSLAGCLWLKVSHEVGVKLSAKSCDLT